MVHSQIDAIYRKESRRIFATLVRLLGGDFDLAEDCMHEAFAAAIRQWPQDGVPGNPRAWLVSAARFKGIDRLRGDSRAHAAREELLLHVEQGEALDTGDEEFIQDDRLRLIFTCCHPALAANVQVALTLREVCGLSTEMIAAAFLLQPATLAQRLVRGKAKIRSAGIPYEIPSPQQFSQRLDAVLAVIYLVFNEGYSASAGDALTRPDLSGEAIRLARLLMELAPEPEVRGLLALMLLHDARRPARVSTQGELVLLEDQDRSLWKAEQMVEGRTLLEQALSSRRFGSYTLQAAISAVHSDAATAAETDWPQIVALYDLLRRAAPSPVVELNSAVAIAMRDGAETGLIQIDQVMADGKLDNYHLAHAAKADLHRRLGQTPQARTAYKKALQLVQQGPEQRFLERRLARLKP